MKKILAISFLFVAFIFAQNQAVAQCGEKKQTTTHDCGDKAAKTHECGDKQSKAAVELKVKGNCSMCKERIEKAALGVAGVKSAVWDKKTQTLKVELSESATIEQVDQAVAMVGHDTEKTKSTDEAYNKLEDCCKYTR